MLRAQHTVLDEDVELLFEVGSGQGRELVRRRVDVGEVMPGLAVMDAAGQRQAPVVRPPCREPGALQGASYRRT
jgi:hypothetical protein